MIVMMIGDKEDKDDILKMITITKKKCLILVEMLIVIMVNSDDRDADKD